MLDFGVQKSKKSLHRVARGAEICDGHRTVLQATYAQYARLDARPHEKTFQTWTE